MCRNVYYDLSILILIKCKHTIYIQLYSSHSTAMVSYQHYCSGSLVVLSTLKLLACLKGVAVSASLTRTHLFMR